MPDTLQSSRADARGYATDEARTAPVRPAGAPSADASSAVAEGRANA